jgi:hypothetical protein
MVQGSIQEQVVYACRSCLHTHRGLDRVGPHQYIVRVRRKNTDKTSTTHRKHAPNIGNDQAFLHDKGEMHASENIHKGVVYKSSMIFVKNTRRHMIGDYHIQGTHDRRMVTCTAYAMSAAVWWLCNTEFSR